MAVDPVAARAEAKAALARLEAQSNGATAPKPGDAGRGGGFSGRAAAADKSLRDLLEARLKLLDEYDKAVQEHADFLKGAVDPGRERIVVKSELARITKRLTEAQTNPEVLLPEAFRSSGGSSSSDNRLGLKEAMDVVAAQIQEDRTRLEQLRGEREKLEGPRDPRRDERDKLFQKTAVQEAERNDFTTAVAAASSAVERRLAQERLVNYDWRCKLEKTRLLTLEARIQDRANRSDVLEWEVERLSARMRLGQRTLECMRDRFRKLAENRERDLKKAAAAEEAQSQRSTDPIERFRAGRTAELLTLEALLVHHEQSLAASPSPSLHEQRDLADRTEADFARIRELLEDGQLSRLDAIRLNNDFRRIGPERANLAGHELADAEALIQHYESQLSSVEIELLGDSLHNQFELDFTSEHPPAERVPEGMAIWGDLESRHRELLKQRRAILEKLVERATRIHQQVVRRLALLDEEYGFIRTHIFWVRDQEPLGSWALVQLGLDVNHLAAGILTICRRGVRRDETWGRPSGEFITAALAVAALPLGLARVRKGLLKRIAQCDEPPPPPPTGEATEAVNVQEA